MKILYRYIFIELLMPCFFSLIILTFVLLLTKILNIAELIFDKNVDGQTVFNILSSITLYLTGITLPLAFLMGILMCFGRMSSDNEITALRTSGISILRISIPVVFLAFMLFILSFFLQVSFLPRANWNTMKSLNNIAKNVTSLLTEKTWLNGFGDSSIYINNLDEEHSQFRNIAIHQPVEGKNIPRVITAEKGNYYLDNDTNEVNFTLLNGYIDDPDEGSKTSYIRIEFENYSIKIPVTQKIFSEPRKRIQHLTHNELNEKIKNTPYNQIDYRYLAFEKHNRMAMAFAVLVFFLIAFPMSMYIGRSEKSANFAIGFLLALSWYILMLVGRAISLGTSLPVTFGSWLPNIIMGSLGIYLTSKMVRT